MLKRRAFWLQLRVKAVKKRTKSQVNFFISKWPALRSAACIIINSIKINGIRPLNRCPGDNFLPSNGPIKYNVREARDGGWRSWDACKARLWRNGCQNSLGIRSRHRRGVGLPPLVFVQVPIITHAADYTHGDAIHRAGRLHLEPDKIVRVSQLVPFAGVLYQLLARADAPVLYSDTLGNGPQFSLHNLLPSVLSSRVKLVVFLTWVIKRRRSVFFGLNRFIKFQTIRGVVGRVKFNVADSRPDYRFGRGQYLTVA